MGQLTQTIGSSPLRVGTRTYAITPIAALGLDRMPYSLRPLVENLARRSADHPETAEQLTQLLAWSPARAVSVLLHPSRVFLHDTNGVPVLLDLAMLRDAVAAAGGDPAVVNPSVPTELVVDHSIVADAFGSPQALHQNVEHEYQRNAERYRFLRWAQRSFDKLVLVPPGNGIMHQLNAERLADVVHARDGWAVPDLCIGTDSHTTMINGLGVLGWGVGGIEAAAAMLGQPISTRISAVAGVRLRGMRRPTVTATDLALLVTERLRAAGVVGSFVEFFGPAMDRLTIGDRLTIANMSPEFGATCAYFPIDRHTIDYLRLTGRSDEHVALVEHYARTQRLWHEPSQQPQYSDVIDLDLCEAALCVAGPRRPQDRVPLSNAPRSLRTALSAVAANPVERAPTPPVETDVRVADGFVVIASITSCMNTANPASMLAAGLLARNAVRRGLRSKPWVKTTLSPGSRSVTAYLDHSGLTEALQTLGFHVAGYGCMTCIGGSGALIDEVADQVRTRDLSVVAVLSGNRNFDGRINPDVRLSYLACPALVVAYALAGRFDIDLTREPLGTDSYGRPVPLDEIWPDPRELDRLQAEVIDARLYRGGDAGLLDGDARWKALTTNDSDQFHWPDSTYLVRPPFLDDAEREPHGPTDIHNARVLLMLGDSITTDHISPAGAIPWNGPAGRYLATRGVPREDLSSYAARRGNHEVMARAAFANTRIRNKLVPSVEGGLTRNFASHGETVDVYTAAMDAARAHSSRVIVAGRDYGTGSSRDAAAKCTALLGVRAVLAESFERIHRANLVGMGVLPLQFQDGLSAAALGLTGAEHVTITGIAHALSGSRTVRVDAETVCFDATVRVDTELEAHYFRHGGVLPAILRQLLTDADGSAGGTGRAPVPFA